MKVLKESRGMVAKHDIVDGYDAIAPNGSLINSNSQRDEKEMKVRPKVKEESL